jgi:universal stress protein A
MADSFTPAELATRITAWSNAVQDYTQIIVAVDVSEEAGRVLERAKRLAGTGTAALFILHVFEYIPPIDLADDPLTPVTWVGDDPALLQAREARLGELAERHGLGDCPRAVVSGGLREEILRHARERGADLIIVGSHGRHGLAALLGSTASGLVREAPCDLLAVRIAEDEGAAGQDGAD